MASAGRVRFMDSAASRDCKCIQNMWQIKVIFRFRGKVRFLKGHAFGSGRDRGRVGFNDFLSELINDFLLIYS
jgi:hypothetical protein